MNIPQNNKERFLSFVTVVIVGVLIVAGAVSAATTISTNIQTDGTLSVTGTGNIGTTTVTNLVSSNTSTSTFAGGVSLSNGCFSVGGNCLGSGGRSIITATFLLCAGPCTVNETSNWKWSAPANATVKSCLIDSMTYPTGAAITVDVLKSGVTTIFTSTIPTLAAGSSAYNEQTNMAAAATLSKGDFLVAKVLTIGSSVAGQYVNVICKVELE